jgi:hypothetical protein
MDGRRNGRVGPLGNLKTMDPQSLRLTSFIYQKWYIYKYS